MGKLGPAAEQPFSLSQPNREVLCHLSLPPDFWDGSRPRASTDSYHSNSNSVSDTSSPYAT